MKSLLRDKTTSVCLICGHKGHHDIIVTNISTYLNSSGTSLANFLFKVSIINYYYYLLIFFSEDSYSIWKNLFSLDS